MLFISSVFATGASMADEGSVRGSIAVLDASPDLQIGVIGREEALSFQDGFPRYLPGLFSAEAEEGERLFVETSNEVSLLFEGSGFFGVERFESAIAEAGDGRLQENTSRMILNLRKGLLLVDSRALDEESQFIVELPFGRISGPRALWFVRIEFDHRSGIYDFTVACDEGFVRLSDLTNESYLVYPGQRLAGAGSYAQPAIEVGEHTDQTRQRFDGFSELQSEYGALGLDRAAMLEQMFFSYSETPPARPNAPRGVDSSKRPVVIELAPRAPRLSPFRGELRLPRDLEEIAY